MSGAVADGVGLPRAARDKLGTLVTEVHGVARVLHDADATIDRDTLIALALWLDRIAEDLGAMECRQYAGEMEAAR